jgi:uncharacterized alkaline shock family protein YloU
MIDRKLQEIFNWSFSEAINNPLYLYAIGLFFLLCLILYIIRRLKKDLINIFEDDNGNVQITQDALHELVGKTCEEIPGVFVPSTTIFTKRGTVRLSVRIRIKQDCNIKEIRSKIQDSIEKTMVQNLSFNNFQGCDVIIKGFQKDS